MAWTAINPAHLLAYIIAKKEAGRPERFTAMGSVSLGDVVDMATGGNASNFAHICCDAAEDTEQPYHPDHSRDTLHAALVALCEAGDKTVADLGQAIDDAMKFKGEVE